jgi:4'-phosphopantetheinyl transferase EntD
MTVDQTGLAQRGPVDAPAAIEVVDAAGTGDPSVERVVAALAHALWSIAPDGVRVGVRRIDPDDVTALFAEDQLAVARAVTGRRNEYATGRALLRSLIGRQVPIATAPNRAPVFPCDVRGSLAHDREFAVAAISTDPQIRAIGIDIEPTAALAPEMCSLIVRSDEEDLDAHLAFTLKEATYKAWSGLGGRMLDFHEVRLHIDGSRFDADVVTESGRFHGRFATAGDRWVALVVAPWDRR